MCVGVENKMKIIKNFWNKAFRFLSLYYKEMLFSFLILFSFFAAKYFDLLIGTDIDFSPELIIVLLPTTMTMLSIIVSLPNALICGVEMTHFRKLSGKRTYNFLEMLLIGVTIIALYSLANGLGYLSPVLILSLISLIYTILFLVQEVPLLLKSKRRIEKIVRIGYSKVTNNQYLDDAIQNLLLNDGMLEVFGILKTRNIDKNKILVEKLFSLQNDYLWKYLENSSPKIHIQTKEFKNIKVDEAVDTLIGSLNDIINLKEDLNVLDIYGEGEFYYHITRSMFSLNKVFEIFLLEANYEKQFADLFNNIFSNITIFKENTKAKKFYYKILNAMLINTLSSQELWFVKLLRNYCYVEGKFLGGTSEYLVFISNYIYYLITLENAVPQEFKMELKEFINEVPQIKDYSYATSSLKSQLQSRLSYRDLDTATRILEELMFIFDSNNDSNFWYIRPSGVVYSSSFDRMFTKKLLMDWWIANVLTDDHLQAYIWNNNYNLSLPNLSDKDLDDMAKLLNQKWFDDENLRVDIEIPYCTLFGLKNKVDKYLNKSEITNTLAEFKNKQLKDKIQYELTQHPISDSALNEYIQILKTAFIKSIEKLPFFDQDIELTNESMTMFSLLCDTRWSSELINKYAEQLPSSLHQLIFNDFKENIEILKIKRTINNYDVSDLEVIQQFKPNYKYAFIYDYNASEKKQKLIEYINSIKPTAVLHFPHDVFLKEDAIKLNFHYIDEESTVRRLTEDEVNQIIDRDFKMIDGRYKYIEGANGDSTVFLTREEVRNIVSDKYFYSRMGFKYKIQYNIDKILYFEVKH